MRSGGVEKAHSRQRRWCMWSKPVNLGTWGLVPDPIAMAHAFAKLGYGTVVHTRESGFKCGHFPLRPFMFPKVALLAHNGTRTRP